MKNELLLQLDMALRTLLPPKERESSRPFPDEDLPKKNLNKEALRKVSALMRVNHAGEVCAQALYQGQALTARSSHIKVQMTEAQLEENDHLAWCEKRLSELNSHPSYLNPIWYFGSFCLGAIAGLLGDKISLGFVAETERQVSLHLKSHLEKLPEEDEKTRAILTQMEIDESKHQATALKEGGIILPQFIQTLMKFTSKIMTRTSYHL